MRFKCSNPVLLIYLSFTYAVPAILIYLLDYQSLIYFNPSNGFVTWLYASIIFCIIIFFAFKKENNINYAIKENIIIWKVPVKQLFIFLLFILSISALGSFLGLSRWRYAEQGLSESLSFTSITYVLAPNILEMLLFVFLFFQYNISFQLARIFLLMIAVGLGLTASGIGPLFTVLLAVLAAFAPETVRRLIFRSESSLVSTSPIWYKLPPLFLLAAGLGVSVYVVGNAIKSGSTLTEAIYSMQQDDAMAFFDYLIGRISVQWYSFVVALHQSVELGGLDHLQNLSAPLSNAAFRLSSLMGGWMDIERPIDGSLSRINYNLINLYPVNFREGTTPGLAGAFVLAFPIFLAPFALFLYLLFYNKVQSGLRRRFAGRPTIFGETIFVYFTMIFFASPVDFLIIFDPMFLSLVLWCYLGLSSKRNMIQNASIRSSV